MGCTRNRVPSSSIRNGGAGPAWSCSGDHGIDAVLAGSVAPCEELTEGLPAAEAHDDRARDVAGRAGIPVREQLPALIDGVDTVLARGIAASEDMREGL